MNIEKHTSITKEVLVLISILITLPGLAVDDTYYSSLNNKKDSELRQALSQLLYNHHIYYDKYDGSASGTENWDFPFDYDNNGYVWDIYTHDCNMPSTIGSGQSCCCDGLNREHLVCQSTFGGSANKDKVPQYADRHALFLTDARTNQIRNDQAFGEVDKTSDKATNGNGSSCTNCTNHAYGWKGPVKTYANLYESTELVYEPGDEYKGDIARAILYMVVRYAERQYSRLPDGAKYYNSATGVGEVVSSDLTTASAHEVTTWKNKGGSTASTIGQMFSTDLSVNYGLSAYGKAILLKWHREDPVSQKEIDRNAGVESVQGNRNPFIDYPCLVEYLWGNYAGQNFNTDAAAGSFQTGLFEIGLSDGCTCTTDPIIIQPFGTIDFGTTNTELPVSETFVVRGLHLTGNNNSNLSLSISGTNAGSFSLSTTTISKADASSGKEITITFAPQSIGTHTAKLNITGCGVTVPRDVTLTGVCDSRPTVTWMADGNVYQKNAVVSGDKPIVPVAPSDCSGEANRVFVGWTAQSDYNSADAAPADLFTKTAPTVSANTTFHAVYANATISGGLFDYALFTGEVVEGNYILYYNGRAMKAAINSSRFTYDEVTPTNNIISDPSDSIVWHIEPNEDNWLIYNEKVGKYAASTGNDNQGKLVGDATDEKALWSISGTNTHTIENNYNQANSKNYTLRNNAANGFACYKATTGGAPVLYKSTMSIEYSDYSLHCSMANYVTITFHKNDGSGTTMTQMVQKNTSTALTHNSWTREHYTFEGWATSANGAKVYNDGININTDSNMDLYAVWTENAKHTVTWHVLGDASAVEFYEGDNLAIPTTPNDCDADRVFVGWTTQSGYTHDSDAPNDLFSTASGTVTADAHYYAVYADKVTTTGAVATETATFVVADFEGQGTATSGSAISATKNGVTFANNKGYGTTQIRCYKNGTITISSDYTITGIAFTFSGSDNGGLDASYTGLSTNSWTYTLSTSKAYFTQIVVTIQTNSGLITTYSKYNTLCSSCVSASTPSPSFANSSVSTMTLDEEVTNALNKDGSDGEITYSSDQQSVATVNATTGAVTIVGPGTTTISASLAGTSCFTAASASYTLTVHDFQATSATNVTNSGFTANWATAGVSSYSLDVTQDVTTVVPTATTFISKNFTASLDGWTTNNVSGYANVWTHSTKYGAYATSYIKEGDEYTRYAAESWLISPSIDLTDATAATLVMNHAFRYATTQYLMITKDGGSNWTQLSPATWPDGSSWTFVNTEVDLAAYVGETIQIGFKYVGSTEACATWEIKTFAISGTANVPVVSHESISGYPKTVTGTSVAVTGLESGTTYHYTLTPSGGNVSNEIDVTTSETGCTATITVISDDDTKGTVAVDAL